MKHGIYALSNPDYKGVLKIGMTTTDIKSRLRGINTTGVLNDWRVEHFYPCDNPSKLEKAVHSELSSYRIKNNREMFSCTISDFKQAIDAQGSLASQKIYNRLKKKERTAKQIRLEKEKEEQLQKERNKISRFKYEKTMIDISKTYSDAEMRLWDVEFRLDKEEVGGKEKHDELMKLAQKKCYTLKYTCVEKQKADWKEEQENRKDTRNNVAILAGWAIGLAATPATGGLSLILGPAIHAYTELKK